MSGEAYTLKEEREARREEKREKEKRGKEKGTQPIRETSFDPSN